MNWRDAVTLDYHLKGRIICSAKRKPNNKLWHDIYKRKL